MHASESSDEKHESTQQSSFYKELEKLRDTNSPIIVYANPTKAHPTRQNVTTKSETVHDAQIQTICMPVARRSYTLDKQPRVTQDSKEFAFYVGGVLKRKLIVLRKIGSGGIARVYLAEDVTIERPNEKPWKYALKIIDTHDNKIGSIYTGGFGSRRYSDTASQNNALLIREAMQTVRQFGRDCKQIAEVMEDYHLPSKDIFVKDHLYVVLRYYEHSSLKRLMKKQNQQFSQEFIEKIICDLFNPLGIMHSRSVVHRDISPCNLLIKQHNRNGTVDIVLNDFDFVFEMGTAAHTKVGKERYMAPEISSGNYETKVDIWSAGVTLIELMTLSKRHRLNTMTEHNEEQMHDRLRAQLNTGMYSNELIDLVLGMVMYNSHHRPSASDVYAKCEKDKNKLFTYGYATENTDIISLTGLHSLGYACYIGNIDIVKQVVRFGFTAWNEGLFGACRGGHEDIIELMIERGANDLNFAFVGACIGGHIDIINILINKGIRNWNQGLLGACAGGHIDIVNIMIKKGASNWQEGFECACAGGFVDIVQMMMDAGAKDINAGLLFGCMHEQTDIVQYMIDKGADNWSLGLRGACCGGHIDLIEKMINKGADVNYGLQGACEAGRYDIAEMMIDAGANDWNMGLCGACFSGDMTLIRKMLNQGADNWNNGLFCACAGDKTEAIEMMIEMGATDWDSALFVACDTSKPNAIKMMLEKGADPYILKDYLHVAL